MESTKTKPIVLTWGKVLQQRNLDKNFEFLYICSKFLHLNFSLSKSASSGDFLPNLPVKLSPGLLLEETICSQGSKFFSLIVQLTPNATPFGICGKMIMA